MKKSIVLFFVFLVVAVKAQQGFINAYNFNNPTAVIFNAMLLNVDEVIVAGYIVDSIPPYQQGMFLARIDTMGTIIHFGVYFDSLGYSYAAGASVRPGGLIKLQDGSGYLFTGNIFEGSSGFLAKFDLQGNVEWVKILEDNLSITGHYYKMIESETGFLVAGSKQVLSGVQSDIFLLKTDKQGNVLWEEQYGQVANGDLLNSFIEINNNEYILGGLRGAGGSLSATQVQIFAVDSLGQQKWYWESNTPPVAGTVPNRGCFGLHHDPASGNWTYATVRVVDVGFQNYYETGQFVVRDSNFNLLMEREYDDVDGSSINGGNHFYNLMQLSDGDWLGVGSNLEFNTPPNSVPPSHIFAYLNRISNGGDGLSTLGDSLWTRLDLAFPDSNFVTAQYLHSAVELPSGSIIAAGYFTGYGAIPDHGLLIKINQHGCIDTLNCEPTNFPNVTSISLTTCDSTAVGTEEYIYPDQNGEDSIVIVTTTLLLPPETPVLPAEIIIEEDAPPFSISIAVAIAGATTYEWTVPAGVQILSGADSTSIMLDWSGWNMEGLVCVSAGNECGESQAACTEITVEILESTESPQRKAYALFPNPVDEVLHILFEEASVFEITMLDVLGRTVVPPAEYLGKAEITTEHLTQGVYWLRLRSDEAIFMEWVEVLR